MSSKRQYKFIRVNDEDVEIVKDKRGIWVFCDKPGVNKEREAKQLELANDGQSYKQSWFNAIKAFPRIEVPVEYLKSDSPQTDNSNDGQ